MFFMRFWVMSSLLSSCPSEALETGSAITGLVKEPPDLQNFINGLESEPSMTGSFEIVAAANRCPTTWCPVDESLELALSLGTHSSRRNAQEAKLQSKNLVKQSADHTGSSDFSWFHQVQLSRRPASDPNDQSVQNHLNNKGPSPHFGRFFAKHHTTTTARDHDSSEFVSEGGRPLPITPKKTPQNFHGGAIELLKQPKAGISGGSQTKFNMNEARSAPSDEGLLTMGKGKNVYVEEDTKLLVEGTGGCFEPKSLEERYPEEQKNVSQLLLEPKRCIVPFIFSNEMIQSHFETIQKSIYRMNRFIYGKPRSLKKSSKTYGSFHKAIRKQATENGEKQLNTLGLPTSFSMQEQRKLRKKQNPFTVKGWTVHSLPQIVHDIRIICQAFPKAILDANMTVKQLQVEAWHFFFFFCENVESIHAGSDEFLWWISSSAMTHEGIKYLINKLARKNPNSRGYRDSSGVARSLLLLWISFYCKDLYPVARGSRACLNIRFGAILNEFYDHE